MSEEHSKANMTRISHFLRASIKRKCGDTPPSVEAIKQAAMETIEALNLFPPVRVVDVKQGNEPGRIDLKIEIPPWLVDHYFRPEGESQ